MKTKIMATIAVVLVLSFAGMAEADIVELDLFSLGCPTEFNWDTQSWTTDFDLGVEFFEISHVYMDWSGEITAGLAINPTKPGSQPFPLDVGVYAGLSYPPLRITTVWGGSNLSGARAIRLPIRNTTGNIILVRPARRPRYNHN